jgi:electron transfer flavoprotein beta subunit
MVAELCQIPSLLNICKIDWIENTKSIRVERAVELGMIEVLEAPLPVLLAPHQNLNEPRYASLPGIMKAKKKPLVEKDLNHLLENDFLPYSQIETYEIPPEKPKGQLFKGEPIPDMVRKVLTLLRNQSKVI